jgi:hypothetical protein
MPTSVAMRSVRSKIREMVEDELCQGVPGICDGARFHKASDSNALGDIQFHLHMIRWGDNGQLPAKALPCLMDMLQIRLVAATATIFSLPRPPSLFLH